MLHGNILQKIKFNYYRNKLKYKLHIKCQWMGSANVIFKIKIANMI